jgi:predicted ArsR family transcriptional regulator
MKRGLAGPPPPDTLVRGLRAAADPTRLRILRLVAERPRSTEELAPLVGLSESGLSKHLRALTDAGLLSTRRQGWYVLYALERGRLGRLGPERALQIASELLATFGYEPTRTAGHLLILGNCPFQRLARSAPQLVCALNRQFLTGLIEGLHARRVRVLFQPDLEGKAARCCVLLQASPAQPERRWQPIATTEAGRQLRSCCPSRWPPRSATGLAFSKPSPRLAATPWSASPAIRYGARARPSRCPTFETIEGDETSIAPWEHLSTWRSLAVLSDPGELSVSPRYAGRACRWRIDSPSPREAACLRLAHALGSSGA